MTIIEQLKGMNTVAKHESAGTLFLSSRISDADDLRYELEYSVSKIGENLPESMRDDCSHESLRWHRAA